MWLWAASHVILFLQTLPCLHGPIDQDSAALPSLITSVPIIKTWESFSSIAEVLQLSEHVISAQWHGLSSDAFSLWSSVSGTQAPFPGMNKMFSGDVSPDHVVPFHYSRKVQNLVTGWFSPFFFFFSFFRWTLLGHLHLILLTNVSDEHPSY